jgi:hypothetical protein
MRLPHQPQRRHRMSVARLGAAPDGSGTAKELATRMSAPAATAPTITKAAAYFILCMIRSLRRQHTGAPAGFTEGRPQPNRVLCRPARPSGTSCAEYVNLKAAKTLGSIILPPSARPVAAK